MNPKQFTVSVLVSAAGSTGLFAATYAQDFTFADGTTDLGDGTTVASTNGINQVIGNALRVTANGAGNTRSSFRIPALENSSLGWTATFDVTMSAGGRPADGFTFNYGAIPALSTNDATATGHGIAENGFATGNEISAQIDTWENFNIANPPGVGVLQNGASLAGGRTDGSILADGGSVTGSVSITWSPTGVSFTTTGLDNNANFIDLAHTHTGDDSHSWAFSARTGGATEDLIIDNLVITTIPEPTSLALLGLGLVGLVSRRRR